ncbi:MULTISPECIES: 7-cyano-7-deazaguanine synthase QueC [unclassified Paludibacterium]|uniref:7-cyano-7-deazaguanine synthase QueC n=1 Tax=unclassified Paludibacterium TaxID=2618429 RepID=UPI001C03F16C|nr:7-cyano-7-deazaguanine synthase QueC [Paludibacterium sp. B53371]BEV71971.1 7-cyano-7-deazaguanine synthase QueC [Paludibacterium sp. THUN1379]
MKPNNEKALVVLSGGQDSTTCLFWAIRRFGQDNVAAVTFDYGQRHRIELDCARKIAGMAGVEQFVLPIDTFGAIGGNALTDDSIVPQTDDAPQQAALPNTFVPGRNLIFLTFAAALAYTRGMQHIVTGVAQTDYSGYPDCRENTLKALELAIRLGMDAPLSLHAPLMYLTKAETVHLAQEVGAMEAMAWSHTCYNGSVPPCGVCDACRLRARGFAEAGIADPLVERTGQH